MTFKCHSGIILCHSLAIIDDLNTGLARIREDDMDILRAGIDGILSQLLDDGRRSLDDFTSCYLIGNGVGEEMD